MFENLSEKLDGIISKVKGYGTITEDNISEMVREVRLALLEADVNYKIVGEFVNNVKESAIGEEVTKSLKPGEVFVSILRRELIKLLGEDSSPLIINDGMTIVLMSGLQGSGKTTTVDPKELVPIIKKMLDCTDDNKKVENGKCVYSLEEDGQKEDDPNNYLYYSGIMWRVLGVYKIDGKEVAKMISDDGVTWEVGC